MPNKLFSMLLRALALLAFVFSIAPAFSQNPFEDPFGSGKETEARVIPESLEVEPDFYFRVAFTLDLREHYHAYYLNPGLPGNAPSVKWDLPDGFSAGELMFPTPSKIAAGPDGGGPVSYGYEGEVTFISEIMVAGDVPLGTKATIAGTFEWQECHQMCLEGSKEFSFEVEVVESLSYLPEHEEFFQEARDKLPKGPSGWAFQASEDENEITLEASHPDGYVISEPIYFFSRDRQIDAQAAQEVVIKEGKIILTLQRNQENDEVKDSLTGLLAYQSDLGRESVKVDTSLVPDAELSGSGDGASKVGYQKATEAERQAGAEVYDVNAKPKVVTLSGGEEEEVTFFYGMGLLFLGGLILNLMPCVFPVLGLKVMGFVSQAGEDESKIKLHGLVFALGLLVTMWILAAVVISLGLKWGEQLADPIFLVTMIIFFFLMGLNLFGLFEIGTSLTGVGGELQAKKGYSGSFFSGVLTTLVATPCSGPFLGVAMAFALALPPVQAFAAFTVFGSGIASPYVLLSFFPALIKKLPKPGAWMESFKQIMSFFLVATAVFFMDAYLKLVGEDHFNYFLFALVMIGMGFYFYGRWGSRSVPKGKRLVTGYALSGLLVFGGLSWAYSTAKPPEPGLAWREWYPGIVELSRPKERIIWVDYTADW